MSITVISEQKKLPSDGDGQIKLMNTGNFIICFKDPTTEERDFALDFIMKASKLPGVEEVRRKYNALTEDEIFNQLREHGEQWRRWWGEKPDGYVGCRME